MCCKHKIYPQLLQSYDCIAELTRRNPLGFNMEDGHPFYEYKMQRFLQDAAMGLYAETPWFGVYDATGGQIIVKETGDLVCYHIYEQNRFLRFLINSTRFEQAATSEDENNPGHAREQVKGGKVVKPFKFGWLYEENGKYYIKLNLQVRMKDISSKKKTTAATEKTSKPSNLLAVQDRPFDELIAERCSLALAGTGIRYLLQKDLNILLKAGEIANGPTDIAWLRQQVKGAVFDVYVVADCKMVDEATGEVVVRPKCFGCVQCKTSIRDRVSRDREPSLEAMAAQFWSTAFVLDGTQLATPKYTNMVNGREESEFKCNGWHGVYVLSEDDDNDRIYGVDAEFSVIREHTLRAFEQWNKDRQGYSRAWRADKK